LTDLLKICFHIDLLSAIVDDVWMLVVLTDDELLNSSFHWEKTSSSSISIPSRDNVRVRSMVISFLIIEGEETVRISGLEDFVLDTAKDF